MHAIVYSILSAAMLAAGVLAQLVPPYFNNTSASDGDKDGALALHNFFRERSNIPALNWSDNLTDIAQVAADWIASADIPETPINFTARTTHPPDYNLEVIYLSPGTPHQFGAFYQATLAFWADNTHYHGEIIPGGDFLGYSPYTQMMWCDTTCLGIAGAMNNENGTFVVAAYSPPGNVHGKKPYNGTVFNATCDRT